MIRVLIGSLLAAVVLFLWGFVFWELSPLPHRVMQPLPDGAALAQTLKEKIPEDGVYYYPWYDKELQDRDPEAAAKQLMELHTKGPLIQVLFRKAGMESMVGTFVQGFIHFFVSALVAAGLLRIAGPSSFVGRVVLGAGMGLFAAVVGLSQAIWFFYPWSWVLLGAGFTVSGWLLAGLVLAVFVKPKTKTA